MGAAGAPAAAVATDAPARPAILGENSDRKAVRLGGTAPDDADAETSKLAEDSVAQLKFSKRSGRLRTVRGYTTRGVSRALHRIKMNEEHVQNMRQCVRSLLMMVALFLLLLVWGSITSFNQAVAYSRRYRTDGVIGITTASCDVEFVLGDIPEMRYRALAKLASVQWVNDAIDLENATGVAVANTLEEGCLTMPYAECSRVCLLTVVVPPGANDDLEVIVTQPSDDVDKGRPKVTVAVGIRLKSLSIGTWWAAAPTVSVEIVGATIKSLSTRLVDGNVYVRSSEVASIDLQAKGEGSIYVLDHPSPRIDVRLNWRQPSNRLCVASNVAESRGTYFEPGAEWALCDLSGVIAGTSNANYGLYSKAQSHFDANGDGRVTKAEFTSGMAAFMCCGSGAPFSCWCEEYAYRVFPPVDSNVYDRFDLPFPDFLDLLIRQNMSRLIGKPGSGGCYERLSNHVPGGVRTADPLSLYSDKGEIIVTTRQALVGATRYNESVYVHPDRPSGVRLLESDATRLKSSYAGTYTERGSLEEIYLIIDAELGSPGLPRTRWIYTTNAVMAVMPLPLLSFLSLGGLTPDVRHEHVRFINNDCLVDTEMDEATRNTTLSAMHNQLKRALKLSHSDPTELRGLLLLQTFTSANAPSWGMDRLEYFPPGGVLGLPDDERVRTVWSSPTLFDRLTLATALSITFGIAFGVVLYSLFEHRLRKRITQDNKRKEANKIMTLLRHYPHLTIKKIRKVLDDSASARDEAVADASWTEFEKPFALIRMVLSRPITRRFVNSLDRFLEERMERTDGVPLRGFDALAHKAKQAARAIAEEEAWHFGEEVAEDAELKEEAKQFLYLRHIFREYELYCLEYDLPIKTKREEIQRHLVQHYGVRINQLTVSRVRGIKWKRGVIEAFDQEEAKKRAAKAAAKAKAIALEKAEEEAAAKAEAEGAPSVATGTVLFGEPSRDLPPVAAPSSPPAVAADDLTDPPANWLYRFVKEKCDLTKQPGDWIDLKTRPAPMSLHPIMEALKRRPAPGAPSAVVSDLVNDTEPIGDLDDEFGPPNADAPFPAATTSSDDPTPPAGLPEIFIKPGLQPMLEQWCQQHKYRCPSLYDDSEWWRRLPTGVTLRENIRVRQTFGLKFRRSDPDESWLLRTLRERCSLQLHGSWYGIEIFSTLVEMFVSFGTPLILVLVAASINEQWARYIAAKPGDATSDGSIMRPPLLFHDLVQPVPLADLYNAGALAAERLAPPFWHNGLYPLCAWLIWESAAFAAATLIRMIVCYTAPPFRRLVRFVSYLYALLLMLHLILICILAMLVLAWFLVATVLKPQVYLPWGTAFLIVLIVCRSVASSMLGAAKRLASVLTEAATKLINIKLERARRRIKQQSSERLLVDGFFPAKDPNDLNQLDSFDAPLGPVASPEWTLKEEARFSKEIKAADIFALLKESRDADRGEAAAAEESAAMSVREDGIEKHDFQRLFLALDLDFTDGQTDRLFAMCDINGNAFVTEQEFVDAWDALVRELLEEAVQANGVSIATMVATVIMTFISIVILLSFVLLVLSCWFTIDSFGALVQSGLVAVVGRATVDLRSRSRAEGTPEQIVSIVKQELGQQEEDANDD